MLKKKLSKIEFFQKTYSNIKHKNMHTSVHNLDLTKKPYKGNHNFGSIQNNKDLLFVVVENVIKILFLAVLYFTVEYTIKVFGIDSFQMLIFRLAICAQKHVIAFSCINLFMLFCLYIRKTKKQTLAILYCGIFYLFIFSWLLLLLVFISSIFWEIVPVFEGQKNILDFFWNYLINKKNETFFWINCYYRPYLRALCNDICFNVCIGIKNCLYEALYNIMTTEQPEILISMYILFFYSLYMLNDFVDFVGSEILKNKIFAYFIFYIVVIYIFFLII